MRASDTFLFDLFFTAPSVIHSQKRTIQNSSKYTLNFLLRVYYTIKKPVFQYK